MCRFVVASRREWEALGAWPMAGHARRSETPNRSTIRAKARAGVRRTLARQGLRATLKGSVRLPGGQLVLGWAISCACGDQCRIRYRPPPR